MQTKYIYSIKNKEFGNIKCLIKAAFLYKVFH